MAKPRPFKPERIPRSTVKNTRRRHGAPMRKSGHYLHAIPPDTQAIVAAQYLEAGMTVKQLAVYHSVHPDTILATLKREGVATDNFTRNARLEPARLHRATFLRDMIIATESWRDVAETENISVTQLRRLVHKFFPDFRLDRE